MCTRTGNKFETARTVNAGCHLRAMYTVFTIHSHMLHTSLRPNESVLALRVNKLWEIVLDHVASM